jgi:hypothetical protein
LKIKLVAHTPSVEVMVATSMLTTTSGSMPSSIHGRLMGSPEEVGEVVGRLEVQHGNILEHNRLIWEVEATSDEVLEAMLDTRFLHFTRLGDDRWLMSGNLRAVVEYAQSRDSAFTRGLADSVRDVAPMVHSCVWGRRP